MDTQPLVLIKKSLGVSRPQRDLIEKMCCWDEGSPHSALYRDSLRAYWVHAQNVARNPRYFIQTPDGKSLPLEIAPLSDDGEMRTSMFLGPRTCEYLERLAKRYNLTEPTVLRNATAHLGAIYTAAHGDGNNVYVQYSDYEVRFLAINGLVMDPFMVIHAPQKIILPGRRVPHGAFAPGG